MRALKVLAMAAMAYAGPVTAQQVTVGPNVHVSSGRSGDPNYEVIAAADPRDASRLLVGAIHRRVDGAGTAAYVSLDGGETWAPTLEAPPLGRAQGASSDPAVMYDTHGTAYFLTSLLPPNSSGPARKMLLYRSADGGRSWQPPVYFTYSDRQYVAVDDTGGRFSGRIYVSGNSRVGATSGHATLFYSTDGGTTFTETRTPKLPVTPVMGNLAVLSDGTVLVLHSAARPGVKPAPGEVAATLRVVASLDGGVSFEPPIDIAPVNLVAGRKGAHNNTIALPLMAADSSRGPYRDRLYVVWPEFKDGHTEIFLSRSSDGGKTWSAPRRVSDTPAPPAVAAPTDQFMATVAVNLDGVVGIVWYDRRDCPDNIGWDVRFAASLDGGDTFLPSVEVSEAGSRFGQDERWIADATTSRREGEGIRLDASLDTFTFLGGDTAGLVADATGRFHVVWVDNSTGTPQAWTAPVTVTRHGAGGPGAGTPKRDERADVTALANVETVDARYDRRANQLHVRARLVNSSDRTLPGPLRVRVTALDSELGNPRAMNADRGGPLVGAEWDFVTGSSGLAPGQRSQVRTLVFELRDIEPYRDGDRYRRGLVRSSLSVVGGAIPEAK